MSRIVVIGREKVLTDLIAASLAADSGITSCRVAGPDDDLGALVGEGHDVAVVVPEASHSLLDAAEAERIARALHGASQVILVSSAAVYEPTAHHPGMVREGRLPPLRLGNRLAASWRRLEERFRAALERSEAVLSVLRPAAVVVRGGNNFWSRLLSAGKAVTVAGFDPTVQLLAGEDLAAAVRRAAERRRAGTWNVAPAGAVPLRQALRASRTWRVPLPFPIAWLIRKVLAPFGAAPTDHLDYLCYSWTISGAWITEDLGFQPSWTSVQAIAALRGELPDGDPEPAPEFDDFGFDPEYVDRLGKVFFRFMHDAWWRIEWKGLEHVPREGPVVLTGVHRGHQPWDGVMAMYNMTRTIGRTPRFLIHPTLVKFPFLAPYMIKCGGLHASNENASRVLERGEMLAIFPEGIRGAFRKYEGARTYRLGKFGRDEYVKMALRHRAPIVPFVTVGSAEIFPILAKLRWSWWKRFTEWPCFPVTPTFSTVPLPSKWHTLVLEPFHVERRYPPEAAADRATVRAISAEVKRHMQAALDDLLERRRSIFYGSIFDREEAAAVEGEA